MEERSNILREMNICRFCLSEDEPLNNIYVKGPKDPKQSVPLPLQIMSCMAIEVFPTDGMPQQICKTCRLLTQQAYNFRTSCKRADDALKLYIATGNLVKPNLISCSVIQQDYELIENEEGRDVREHTSEPPLKKSKPEFVTLNYSNVDMSLKSNVTLDNDETLQHDEEMDEDSRALEENTDEDVDQDDETRNNIFKIPQVQTDVFPCPHCERSFPLEQLLEIHVKNHVRDRCFTCDECSRKFFTKYDLGKHMQTHSNVKPFTCVVCKKQFSRESLLHRHEKIHNDVPKYLCTFCDKTFLTGEDLDAHCERHKKKRPFACRLCNKSFVFKQGLERHEVTHADQKPHKCNYCEASFTSPIKLTRHITSHAGLRPYPCKTCGRTFLLSHHLTRHMRSHYAMKSSSLPAVGQHKCDVCSMSFRRKDSLINHSAIHSMVNLKCVICNTAFESAKMVKEHITTHLSGLPYPCDRCDYSFETQDQLEEHELKHAEMEYEEQIEKEVSLEAQAQNEEEDEDDYDSENDSVAEYTITNPDNPEIIRRSKREPKIKNYAQFLKDELGSDLEEENHPDPEFVQEEEEEPQETIKPVIRSEGTKVYVRKSAPDKPKFTQIVKPAEVRTVPLEQITQQHPQLSLDNLELSKQAVEALGLKDTVNTKIGDIAVKVRRRIVTKAELAAMAKHGTVEIKGNTILYNKNLGQDKFPRPTGQLNFANLPIQKQLIKKTYVRKALPIQHVDIKQPSTSNEELESKVEIQSPSFEEEA